MRILIAIAAIFLWQYADGQNLAGTWIGTISRDFGTEIKVDTIEMKLQQNGLLLTGTCTIRSTKGKFVTCQVEGEFLPASHLLKISETTLLDSNLPGKAEVVFDRYLFDYNGDDNYLEGKSIAKHFRQLYGHSKVVMRKG